MQRIISYNDWRKNTRNFKHMQSHVVMDPTNADICVIISEKTPQKTKKPKTQLRSLRFLNGGV